jgi:hypothetical protein
VLDGGPFTAVQGTFNVPALYSSTSSGSVAEWVGIDGDTAANPSVFQAGVAEDYNAATNLYRVHAWWESFPAPPVDVPVRVTAGDQVTVKIVETGAAVWTIVLTDNTNGQSFSTLQSYSGPATSAEWIVEAPGTIQNGTIQTLAHYASPVTFTNLGVIGSQGGLTRMIIVQNGVTLSVPSAITSAGFTVAYGNVTPTPPG